MQENAKKDNSQITSNPDVNLWKSHVKGIVMLQALYRGYVARRSFRKLKAAKVSFVNS